MKIVQAAVLVLVGALGAMLYVKMKGGPQPEEVVIHNLPEAQPLAQPSPAEEPPAASAPDSAAPESAPPPVRRARKHARVLTSSLRKTESPSNPIDVQPVPQSQPAPPLNPPVATPPPAPEAAAANPAELTHQAIVEEQKRRDREAEAERDRDDL